MNILFEIGLNIKRRTLSGISKGTDVTPEIPRGRTTKNVTICRKNVCLKLLFFKYVDNVKSIV